MVGGGQGWQQPQISTFVWSSKHAQTTKQLLCACLYHQQHQGASSGVFGEQELLFCYMFPCSAFQLLPNCSRAVWL